MEDSVKSFRQARKLVKEGEGRYEMEIAFGTDLKGKPATSWSLVYVNPESKQRLEIVDEAKILSEWSQVKTYDVKPTSISST